MTMCSIGSQDFKSFNIYEINPKLGSSVLVNDMGVAANFFNFICLKKNLVKNNLM